jgi:hypothetical protein
MQIRAADMLKPIKNLLVATAWVLPLGLAAGQATVTETPVSVVTTSGQIVCNASASFAAIPGQPNMFIGRVLAIGSQSFCAAGNFTTQPALGIFQMNWPSNEMVFQNDLFGTPITINGIYVRSSYDPSIMTYNGENWIAWECTPHYGGLEYVSSCMAPLLPDFSGIDQTRFSVPVRGNTGPSPNNPSQMISLSSASIPQLLNFGGTPYIYWAIDHNIAVNTASNSMASRGAMLQQDVNGKFWVFGAGSTPIQTDDPGLTTVVRDVVSGDTTADHVSQVRIVYADQTGQGLYTISNVGGTNGSICLNPASVSQGCWRTEINYTTEPLAYNTFSQNPLPTTNFPINPTGYPRPLTLPNTGQIELFTQFSPPKTSWNIGWAPAQPSCNPCLIPFPPLQ